MVAIPVPVYLTFGCSEKVRCRKGYSRLDEEGRRKFEAEIALDDRDTYDEIRRLYDAERLTDTLDFVEKIVGGTPGEEEVYFSRSEGGPRSRLLRSFVVVLSVAERFKMVEDTVVDDESRKAFAGRSRKLLAAIMGTWKDVSQFKRSILACGLTKKLVAKHLKRDEADLKFIAPQEIRQLLDASLQ